MTAIGSLGFSDLIFSPFHSLRIDRIELFDVVVIEKFLIETVTLFT